MSWETIIDQLNHDLEALSFGPPVSHIYNPLRYARRPHLAYCNRYGTPPREIILLGMNPGPWGMAQTGVPFGEVNLVREWLAVDEPVDHPAREHPKRPITGFSCQRSEVSGRRLWGWAKKRFQRPEDFFARFFVANYCPLVFMEESGRNRTPNTLPARERKALEAVCDHALAATLHYLQPAMVLGIGRFAADRVARVLAGSTVKTGCLTHPSPANPKANRGWEALIEQELADLGITL